MKKLLSFLTIVFIFALQGAGIVYATTLTTDITAYWKTDESSGTAADATGNGFTLTNNNTVTYAAGIINNDANFVRTSSQSLTRTDISGTTRGGNFSYSVWVKVASQPAANTAFGIIDVSQTDVAPNYVEPQIEYSADAGGATRVRFNRAKPCVANSYLTYATTLTTGTWYHIVYTYDGTTGRGYLNASEVASGAQSGVGDAACGSDGTAIGNRLGQSDYMNGMIGEVGIWNKKLTTDEITELYAAGAGNQYPFGAGGSTPPAHDDGIILFE